MGSKLYKFRPYEIVKVEPTNTKSEKLPKPRSGHRIATDSKNLYNYGGYNYYEELDEHRLFRDLWKFNLITNKWKKMHIQKDHIPVELASSSVLMLGNTLIVYGGTSYPFGDYCSNIVYCVNVKNNTITKFQVKDEDSQFPPGRYGNAICVIDKHLYTIGGTEGYHYNCDIHRLNLQTGEWETVIESRPEVNEEDPQGRYRFEIAHNDRYIYIFGGGAAECTFGLKTLPVFDTELGKWGQQPTRFDPKSKTYPSRRKCHSLVQYKNSCSQYEVVIAGGVTENKELDDIWKLNLQTFQWTKFEATIPTNLFFHDSCITSSYCMYIFGGIVSGNPNRNIPTRTRNRTNVIYKMYVDIPKLRDIAFEAFIFYNPEIVERSFNEIVKMGVPLEYAARIVE